MEEVRRLYLRFEKILFPVGLASVLATAFYAIDWNCEARDLAGKRFTSLRTFLDDWEVFRFSPHWIWVYLSYYILVFAPVLVLKDMSMLRKVGLAFFLEYACGFVFFVALPAKMIRPVPGVDFPLDSASARAVSWFYDFDPGYNVFPSMHVANMFLVAFLVHRARRRAGLLVYALAVLITISTLTVKQHYFVDLPAGFLVAVASYRIAMGEWPRGAAAVGRGQRGTGGGGAARGGSAPGHQTSSQEKIFASAIRR